MNNRKKNILKPIIYVLVIIIFLGLIVVTNKRRESTVFETVLSYTIYPIQRGLSYAGAWIGGYREIFPQIDALKEENEQLKNENESIKEKLANYELMLEENTILKDQLNLTEKYPEFKTLSCQIIAEDTSNWYQLLDINQGSNDGIKEGMTVISDKGLVGYVKQVFANTAKVVCVTDTGNSVSCRLTKTKEAVICRGEIGLKEKSQMKLIYIPTDITLAVGDTVETSGMGGIYKKGIKVGEVVEVVEATNNLESYAIVQTSVDFSTLEYVLVVLD